MKENRLRVLVIDGDPDRVQLLEEAFREMEELRFAKPSYPLCARSYALDWQEAVAQLAGSRTDAILLNISGECEPSAPAAFTALRGAAPSAAVIAITSYEEESAALGLVRMGAQDYLIENEIDCDPLARVLRCAVERSRLNWSRQSVSMVDDLTGLYNARGVALLTERDERLAASLDLCRWSVELRLDPDEAADSDLMRLELAEQLSEFSGAGLLAGRAGDDTFVVFGLAASGAAARDAAARVSERLNAARWSLCENR